MNSSILRAAVSLAVVGACSTAQEQHRPPGSKGDVVALAPGQLEWESVGGGVFQARLYGDASSKGYYVFRSKVPANWEAPPHTHGAAEIITVHSGTLYIAYGDDLRREAARAFGPGSFVAFPAGTSMRPFTRGEEVVFDLQGEGPLTTHPLNEK